MLHGAYNIFHSFTSIILTHRNVFRMSKALSRPSYGAHVGCSQYLCRTRRPVQVVQHCFYPCQNLGVFTHCDMFRFCGGQRDTQFSCRFSVDFSRGMLCDKHKSCCEGYRKPICHSGMRIYFFPSRGKEQFSCKEGSHRRVLCLGIGG